MVRISSDNFSTLVAEGRPCPELQEALYKQLPNGYGMAHVILVEDARTYRISVSSNGIIPEELWVNVGCISKLITGAIFLSVFGAGRESHSRRLVNLLDAPMPQWFSDITALDLLNHSHGIDQDIGGLVPKRADGTIDAASLLQGMSPVPIARAGEIYSYSTVGGRLLAAIVEQELKKPFAEIVRDMVPSIVRSAVPDERFCPSLGGSMKINMERLLLYLVKITARVGRLEDRNVRLGLANVFSYPGWHPVENGICLGWKSYNHDWFGHLALSTWTPLSVRVSPSDARGIMICTAPAHPHWVMQNMFSEDLIGGLNRPRLIPEDRTLIESKKGCVGTYALGSNRIRVYAEGSELILEAKHLGKGNESNGQPNVHVARLQNLPGTTLYSVSPANRILNLAAIEFVRNNFGRVSHLWNGQYSWRKTD